MNRVDVWLEDASLGGKALVGHLARTSSRSGETISFEYAAAWQDGRSPIAPFALDPQLALTSGPHYARAGAGHLPPAFVDASPDRWGKLLMDRREAIEAREQARPPRALRAWDYLLGVNDESRMGALRITEAGSRRWLDDRALGAPPSARLRELEAASAALERGDSDELSEASRWIRQLIAPGASLGGARPKASFRDNDGALWLAKFPSSEDRHDVGLWEFLVHQLALRAGIEVPEARALPLSPRGHTFAVRRFDRSSGSRRAYASAMSLLDASDSAGHGYLDLVQAIEIAGDTARINRDLAQLFRRALLNILVGNRDDHLRNHGFLRSGDGWALAPAFDINPNPDKDVHVLTIDESNPTPDSALLMATAGYYRLDAGRASAIADEVRAAVRGWAPLAQGLGCSSAERARMAAVIDAGR